MTEPPREDPTTPEGEAAVPAEADDGDTTARSYGELRRIAEAYMRRERAAHTLQPTALAHEAYLRLAESPDLTLESKPRFLAIAARCMRQILVDHARARNAAKRGGGQARLTLSDTVVGTDETPIDVLDLHDALEELAELDERKVRVVELRFFAGLLMKEVAEVLGISNTTAEDDWYMARAWLRRRLRDTESRPSHPISVSPRPP